MEQTHLSRSLIHQRHNKKANDQENKILFVWFMGHKITRDRSEFTSSRSQVSSGGIKHQQQPGRGGGGGKSSGASTARFNKNSASHALSPNLATASSASNARSSPSFEETSRVKKIIFITDQYSKIFGYRILNSQLSLYIGLLQLIVCIWGFSQHIYSLIYHKKVLYCDFDNVTLTDDNELLVGVDAIIFDIGLFHSLWGIHGCVAQHLDGGYGRFAWCICHIAALVFCLPFAFVSRPKPLYLWPLLIQQSAYGVGLLILSLAALPRVLPTFMGDLGNAPILAIFFYSFGAFMNYLLLYWYWHWYWFIESEYESATKLSHNRLSSDVHADPRRRPFHYPIHRLSQTNGFIPSTQRSLLESSPPGTSATIHMKPNGINVTKQVPYPNQANQGQSNGNLSRDPLIRYNGLISNETGGYFGPMIASPLSQQSQRESINSNMSNLHYSKLPTIPQQQHRFPKLSIMDVARPVASSYDPICSDLLSPQCLSDDYPSDDSGTAPILSHSSPHHFSSSGSKYSHRPFESSQRSLNALKLSNPASSSTAATAPSPTNSAYASMAQARYAKFNPQPPLSFRKQSVTPGGAPLMGNRIALQSGKISQPCSIVNSPSRPSSNSRHGTPIIGPMYSTAI